MNEKKLRQIDERLLGLKKQLLDKVVVCMAKSGKYLVAFFAAIYLFYYFPVFILHIAYWSYRKVISHEWREKGLEDWKLEKMFDEERLNYNVKDDVFALVFLSHYYYMLIQVSFFSISWLEYRIFLAHFVFFVVYTILGLLYGFLLRFLPVWLVIREYNDD